jgi:hypothetical protein
VIVIEHKQLEEAVKDNRSGNPKERGQSKDLEEKEREN